MHPITLIYLTIALFTGRFSYLFLHLFVAFIHECAHVWVAFALRVPVEEMQMLPFGFYAKMDRLEEASWWQQILIILAGPASFIVSYALLSIFYQMDVISIHGLQHALEANRLVLLFNLLPIFPLDGGRAMRLLVHRFFDELWARKMALFISSVTTFIFLGLCLENGQWIVFAFLLVSLGREIRFFKRDYALFLQKRLYDNRPRQIRLSSTPRLYRYAENYWMHDGMIYDERAIIAYRQSHVSPHWWSRFGKRRARRA